MSPRRLDAETLESLVALDNWQKRQWASKDLTGLAFYEGDDEQNPAGTDRQRLTGLPADFATVQWQCGNEFPAGRFELAPETSAINE